MLTPKGQFGLWMEAHNPMKRSPKTQLTWSTFLGVDPHNGDMAGTIVSCPAGGAPNGTFSFEVSDDYDPVDQGGTWDTLDPALFVPAIASPAGGAVRCPVNIGGMGFEWIRARYTRIGGTGTLSGWMKAKE